MKIWQADFYKHPSLSHSEETLWKLLICDNQSNLIVEASCPQSQVNVNWLVAQIQPFIKTDHPDEIWVFRPQSLNLLQLAGQQLGIKIEGNRRTQALKSLLQNRYQSSYYDPTYIEPLPPQPLPENLWGEQWRFVTFSAGELINFFATQPIPFCSIPEDLIPEKVGIASTITIPGIVIYGGRKAIYLARWIAENHPFAINFIASEVGTGGLVLESGLSDRWILATFEDAEIAQAAHRYETRKQASKFLHFLLIQPDDSGMTYSGFWLLQSG